MATAQHHQPTRPGDETGGAEQRRKGEDDDAGTDQLEGDGGHEDEVDEDEITTRKLEPDVFVDDDDQGEGGGG